MNSDLSIIASSLGLLAMGWRKYSKSHEAGDRKGTEADISCVGSEGLDESVNDHDRSPLTKIRIANFLLTVIMKNDRFLAGFTATDAN